MLKSIYLFTFLPPVYTQYTMITDPKQCVAIGLSLNLSSVWTVALKSVVNIHHGW